MIPGMPGPDFNHPWWEAWCNWSPYAGPSPLAGFTVAQQTTLKRLKAEYASGLHCLTEREIVRARFHRWRLGQGAFDDDR